MTDSVVPGSFRDPSGFVFKRDGVLYRQVNESYREEFDYLMGSGLYDALCASGQLVPHTEEDVPASIPELAYKTLRPEVIPFISYPYEWPFSALKNAALMTLDIQDTALNHGMLLKDASAYNVQFVDGKPKFIDTLSFERYHEGEPWVAYGQFCQHFLAPIALMSYCDVRLLQLMRGYIDGIPLDLASSLLPSRTRFRLGLLIHIHMHAKTQSRHDDTGHNPKPNQDAQKKIASGKVSLQALRGVVDNLRSAISKLAWKPSGTEWGDYYEVTNYSSEAEGNKERLVSQFIERVQPEMVWDLGANTGRFSRLASKSGVPTVAFDIDPAAVEKNFLACDRDGDRNMLPLILDLTNPSPSLGWRNQERDSLFDRGPAPLVLALALVHHLAISNNVPLPNLAEFFAGICRSLVIEFVPKNDSQVRRLLATRDDIFPDYTPEGFEQAFAPFFTIEDTVRVEGSERALYLMHSK
jgi:hypothetical protein